MCSRFCNFRAASQPFGVLTEKTDGANEILVREQTGNRSLVLFDSGDEVTVQAGDEGIRFCSYPANRSRSRSPVRSDRDEYPGRVAAAVSELRRVRLLSNSVSP